MGTSLVHSVDIIIAQLIQMRVIKIIAMANAYWVFIMRQVLYTHHVTEHLKQPDKMSHDKNSRQH